MQCAQDTASSFVIGHSPGFILHLSLLSLSSATKCSKKALAELLTSCVGSSEPRVLLPLVPIEGFRASSAKRRCGSERCLSRELGVTRLPLTPKPVHSPCAAKKSPSCKLEISCGSLKPIDLIDLHNTDRPCGVLFSQEQSWPATKLGG